MVERYEKSSLLKQKDKDVIQKKMAEFDAKLVHYGHTNVSEFLKERYSFRKEFVKNNVFY